MFMVCAVANDAVAKIKNARIGFMYRIFSPILLPLASGPCIACIFRNSGPSAAVSTKEGALPGERLGRAVTGVAGCDPDVDPDVDRWSCITARTGRSRWRSAPSRHVGRSDAVSYRPANLGHPYF